jgi:hypothetical protein
MLTRFAPASNIGSDHMAYLDNLSRDLAEPDPRITIRNGTFRIPPSHAEELHSEGVKIRQKARTEDLATPEALKKAFGEAAAPTALEVADQIIDLIHQGGTVTTRPAIAYRIEQFAASRVKAVKMVDTASIGLLREIASLRALLSDAQARIEALEARSQ